MTGTIFHLCLAMGLFVAIYLAMSDRPLRTTAIDRISDPVFMGIYCLISPVTLAQAIQAFLAARVV